MPFPRAEFDAHEPVQQLGPFVQVDHAQAAALLVVRFDLGDVKADAVILDL